MARNGWRAFAAVLILIGAATLVTPAAATEHVTLSTRVDVREVGGSSGSRPVRLRPQRVPVDLSVTNRATYEIRARTVRLSGQVMGLTFYAYEVSVDLRVAPGATESRRFTLDLASLKGQATGLLPGSITLLDDDRSELASQELMADVRGSLRSVYGIFTLVLLVLTAAGFILVLRALASNQLPPNRWARGLRFLVPGIGLGLVLVFGFSVLRILAPLPSRWVPVILLCAVGLFLAGYFSPGPVSTEDDVDERDRTLPGRRP